MGKQDRAGSFKNISSRLPATELLKSDMGSTLEGIEERVNEQLEELSNASNSWGHGDNKDENFDDEEHCKTLSGVSIKESCKAKTTLQIQLNQKRLINK